MSLLCHGNEKGSQQLQGHPLKMELKLLVKRNRPLFSVMELDSYSSVLSFKLPSRSVEIEINFSSYLVSGQESVLGQST